jgi:hypothetical protein
VRGRPTFPPNPAQRIAQTHSRSSWASERRDGQVTHGVAARPCLHMRGQFLDRSSRSCPDPPLSRGPSRSR